MNFQKEIAGLTAAAVLATAPQVLAAKFSVQVLPGMTTNLPACDPHNPTVSPAEKWVIRLGIRENMNILNPGRHVQWEHNRFNGDGANDDGGTKNKPLDKSDPFHVNVNMIDDSINQGEYAMVRVILHDPLASWATWDGKDKGIIGIGVGQNPNQMVCGPLTLGLTKNTKKPLAVFFLKLNQKAAGSQNPKPSDDIATFTIGFSPAYGPNTPIFIDPNIRNPG